MKKKYRREHIEDPEKFDPRSFRYIVRGKHKILIGCPKGYWDDKNKRCRVGTRAVSILHPIGENPKDDIELGIEKYKEFNFKEPEKVIEIDIPYLKENVILVHLGKCDSIAYISDKEGKKITYEHEFGEESGEKPELYTTPRGDILIIYGGNFKVKDWIYD